MIPPLPQTQPTDLDVLKESKDINDIRYKVSLEIRLQLIWSLLLLVTLQLDFVGKVELLLHQCALHAEVVLICVLCMCNQYFALAEI